MLKKIGQKLKKTHYKIFFVVIVLVLVIAVFWNWDFGRGRDLKWGLTFSTKQADELGLDARHVFGTIIDEMPGLRVVRLPIYWDEIETAEGDYDLADYKWMIEKAGSRGVEVMPVVGRRTPRWPECHVPEIYSEYTETELQQKIFQLIRYEVSELKDYSNIKKWQVDNEPFADFFGDCPDGDPDLVQAEIDLVRSLDSRPILITEAGELSTWMQGAKMGDLLGVSMYRMTWSRASGWFYYPFPPSYYALKGFFVKILTGVDDIYNTELQVEPWSKGVPLAELSEFDSYYSMDLFQVKENIKFAEKVGFRENYLWGLEWWYWLGQEQCDWSFWEFGKEFFSK